MNGRRLCLFGGTFDPIHNGHLAIAAEAARHFSLDRVYFVPAANPPHKNPEGMTPYSDRLRMVELACEPYVNFEASRIEDSPERSYTFDTLTRFRRTLTGDDRLFFLIGSDAFDEIETWHRWRDVLRTTTFIVVSRPGAIFKIPAEARILKLDEVSIPISSTDTRRRLAGGLTTPELPAPVRAYIEKRRLYGFSAPPEPQLRSAHRKLASEA